MPAAAKPSRAPVEEAPYQRLREAIVAGALHPNERLVEHELAASLGVPRAAVRTALVRLAQEHLVERLPNRGARVRRVTDKEAVELLEARMALECLAAEHAARNVTAADLTALRAILMEMEAGLDGDLVAYGETNARLHREIIRIADHTIAARLLDSLRSRNTNFHLRAVIVPNDPRVRLEQHRRIVGAIEAYDPAAASEAMRIHLSSVAARQREKRRKEA